MAYATVPASLIGWEPLPSLHLIFIPIYILAGFGLLAAFRGATFPPRLQLIAWVFAAAYAVLLLVEILNGGLFQSPIPADAHFWITYLIILAFPFFALGMRATGATIEGFERVMMACIVVGTVWSLWQFFFTDVERPRGFNSLNTIAFSMVLSLWAALLATRAFRKREIDLLRLSFALLAVVPIVLSGTRLVWICVAASTALLFLWWAIAWRRWLAIPVGAVAIALGVFAISELQIVQGRLAEFHTEVQDVLENSVPGVDAPGAMQEEDIPSGSIPLRYAATVSGLLAFLDSPFVGYGLPDVRIAALTHRPSNVVDFSMLWHLHNQYVVHLVAFGFTGFLFLVAVLLTFPYAGFASEGQGLRRYSIIVAIAFAIFMAGGIVFARSMLYGVLFQLLGIILLAEPAGPKQETGTAPVAGKQPA